MKKLNLGIVGCGGIAVDAALLCRITPNIRLTACCDVRPEQLKKFAFSFRVPHAFTDYKDVLACDDVDAVYLGVPHDLHFDMILNSAKAGKTILTEKPLTRTYAEGVELVEQLAGHKVGVNYQYRYDQGCYAMVRAAQNGELGKIHSVRINIPWHRTQASTEGSTRSIGIWQRDRRPCGRTDFEDSASTRQPMATVVAPAASTLDRMR